MNQLVSIIIPCYNHGEYIDEAVSSCLNQTYKNIEIIIVNDGSTDEFTNTLLSSYGREKTKVITTKNQGLPTARNVGIQEANGKYILPLDADDKIAPTYIEKAVKILEQNSNIGIVYCLAEFFGTQKGLWELPECITSNILNGNCIFCSALFRKSDWEKVGGYKKEMIYGWEDYEFWLSLIEMGRKTYRIPEVLFFYRRHDVSMVTQLNTDEKIKYLYNVIFSFHKDFYWRYYGRLSASVRDMFYKFCDNKTPFFYREVTLKHKIYHIGRLKIKIRRKKRS